MYRIFTSRKFMLFLLVILVATCGWAYALIYKPEQLATISTFLLALLGAYGGANLTETHLANKLTIESSKISPTGKPGNSNETATEDQGQDNG